jgi:hypothetical protein
VLESFSPGKIELAVLTTLEDISPAVRKRLKSSKKDFTLAEVGGMLMAVAGELCVAPLQQQVGLMMAAKALMGTMQDGVNEVMTNDVARGSGPTTRRSKTAKKKPGPKKKPGS